MNGVNFKVKGNLSAIRSNTVQVLGCSGGIGGRRHTTSYLLDDDVLIDCGTGVGELSLEALKKIRHIFITHAHLDHVCMLPLLVDSVFDHLEEQPITLYASEAVLKVLDHHLFNWQIWPDFFSLPSPDNPVLISNAFEIGSTIDLGGRLITGLPADHTVAAQGFAVSNPKGRTLVFSGDTGKGELFWKALNGLPQVDYLLVECAYPEEERDLAGLAKHYTPTLLANDLQGLNHQAEIHVCHLKPGQEDKILSQLKDAVTDRLIEPLQPGQKFSL